MARLSDRDAFSFREAVRVGWRVANAAWLFALLAFLIVAPHHASRAAIAMYAMNGDLLPKTPGPALTPSLIAIMVLSLGSCFWMVLEFFAVPWVHGAAAANLRDRLVFPGRRPGSMLDAGNQIFGRVLVLTIVYWLVMAACSGPEIIATQLLARQNGIDASRNPQQMATLATHPVIIAIGIFAAAFAIIAALILRACVAAIVCEDQGITGAIQRGASFLTNFKGEAWRLLLLGVAFYVPAFLVQQATAFGGFGWPFVAVTVAAAALAAYVDLVLQSVTIVLYLDRRRADVTVYDPHRQSSTAPSAAR
ncbi:MAG: hypothetical protein M3552_11965 [Planctomycetota bacterium]|nr:hypothetical protein [Planctomycetaceae bacterium]MDQ3331350.1 hypothetical protein [Planctomycetota bacterium]